MTPGRKTYSQHAQPAVVWGPRAQDVRPLSQRSSGVAASASDSKGMDPGTLERDMDLGDVGRIRQVSAGQLFETS